MALVAYGSSDESDFSEEEENAPVESDDVGNPTKKSKTQNLSHQLTPPSSNQTNVTAAKLPTPTSELLDGHRDAAEEENDGVAQISDDEELSLEQTGQTIGLSLPAPKNTLANPSSSVVTNAATSDVSILAGLPKPKAADAAIMVEDNEDELEDFVKKKETPIEKPPPKKRLPVKITIPTLSQTDSDEEDAPSKKKQKFSSGSSLFSMLPAPQHAPIKEINRPLVPHSLTKKPTKPLTPIPKSSPSRPAFPKPSAKTAHLPGVPEDDSDEEESSGGNFFSLAQSSKRSSSSVAGPNSYMSKIASTVQARPMDVSQPKTVTIPENEACSGQTLPPTEAEYISPSDAPLTFKARDGGGGYQGQWGRTGMTGVSANQMYNLAHVDAEEESVQQEQQVAAVAGPSKSHAYGAPDTLADVELTEEEQMMRLAGKRQFKREEVNIIDVNQEDQVDRAEMLKNISEEEGANAAYASHKAKDLPGGTSKRKHQITYLGHLAKARELDLKNQWSQNKMSRRQSAMKYGF